MDLVSRNDGVDVVKNSAGELKQCHIKQNRGRQIW